MPFTVSAVLLAICSSATTMALPETVPEFVNQAASGTVNDFSEALAEAAISAGFVVTASDFDQGTTAAWRFRANARPKVSLQAAIATFLGAHRGYEIEKQERVLLVRAAELKGIRVLSKRLQRVRMQGTYLTEAFARTQHLIEPAIPQTGGVAGSVLSSSEEPVSAEDFTEPRVSADLTDVLVLDVFNTLVKQVPGTVWILRCEPRGLGEDSSCKLAVRRPKGRITVFHDELRQ